MTTTTTMMDTTSEFFPPTDRELALRGVIHTGWSTVAAKPPRVDHNLPQNELKCIQDVLGRAEALERMEEIRIGVHLLKHKQMVDSCRGDGVSSCLICGLNFSSQKSESRKQTGTQFCEMCGKGVCQRCKTFSKTSTGELQALCRVCVDQKELWKRSGAWLNNMMPLISLSEDELLKAQAQQDLSKKSLRKIGVGGTLPISFTNISKRDSSDTDEDELPSVSQLESKSSKDDSSMPSLKFIGELQKPSQGKANTIPRQTSSSLQSVRQRSNTETSPQRGSSGSLSRHPAISKKDRPKMEQSRIRARTRRENKANGHKKSYSSSSAMSKDESTASPSPVHMVPEVKINVQGPSFPSDLNKGLVDSDDEPFGFAKVGHKAPVADASSRHLEGLTMLSEGFQDFNTTPKASTSKTSTMRSSSPIEFAKVSGKPSVKEASRKSDEFVKVSPSSTKRSMTDDFAKVTVSSVKSSAEDPPLEFTKVKTGVKSGSSSPERTSSRSSKSSTPESKIASPPSKMASISEASSKENSPSKSAVESPYQTLADVIAEAPPTPPFVPQPHELSSKSKSEIQARALPRPPESPTKDGLDIQRRLPVSPGSSDLTNIQRRSLPESPATKKSIQARALPEPPVPQPSDQSADMPVPVPRSRNVIVSSLPPEKIESPYANLPPVPRARTRKSQDSESSSLKTDDSLAEMPSIATPVPLANNDSSSSSTVVPSSSLASKASSSAHSSKNTTAEAPPHSTKEFTPSNTNLLSAGNRTKGARARSSIRNKAVMGNLLDEFRKKQSKMATTPTIQETSTADQAKETSKEVPTSASVEEVKEIKEPRFKRRNATRVTRLDKTPRESLSTTDDDFFDTEDSFQFRRRSSAMRGANRPGSSKEAAKSLDTRPKSPENIRSRTRSSAVSSKERPRRFQRVHSPDIRGSFEGGVSRLDEEFQRVSPRPRSHSPAPDGLCGSIEVTLTYQEEHSQLAVTIVKCKGLRPMDANGLSDPYVNAFLIPGHKMHDVQTDVKFKTLNPEFNETFVFEGITKDLLQDKQLCLVVMDYDEFSKDDFIGATRVNLYEVMIAPALSLTLRRLLDDRGVPHERLAEKTRGKIELKMSYSTEMETFTVHILKAVHLLHYNSQNKHCDSFVKCHINNRGQVLKRKTKARLKTINPEFNEEVQFPIKLKDLPFCCMTVTVKDQKKLKDTFLGEVHFNSISFWKSFMSHPNQVIAGWYNLEASSYHTSKTRTTTYTRPRRLNSLRKTSRQARTLVTSISQSTSLSKAATYTCTISTVGSKAGRTIPKSYSLPHAVLQSHNK